jgi:hypothetical protein
MTSFIDVYVTISCSSYIIQLFKNCLMRFPSLKNDWETDVEICL